MFKFILAVLFIIGIISGLPQMAEQFRVGFLMEVQTNLFRMQLFF
jgi:hypothetical protein